jgi:hypothetical protein
MVAKASACCIYLIFFGLVVDATARHFPPDLHNALHQFNSYIYNDRFKDAGLLLDSLQRHGGPSPICRLYRAVLYQSQMMAAESNDRESELYAILDSVEIDADSILSTGGDSALGWWIMGNSHAFRSLFLGRRGHLFRALKHGLAARNAYSKGYDADSTFYDIALGLGSYRYWKSVKTKAISWTPIFNDERLSGLIMLRLAADSAELSSEAAKAALIWVYINEKRYPEAIRLARQMRYRYPHGLTFLWALGEAYYKFDDCRGAIDIYETILWRLEDNPGNYYNVVEAAYHLFVCYRRLGDRWPEYADSSDSLRSEIKSMPIPEETRERQVDKLDIVFDE